MKTRKEWLETLPEDVSLLAEQNCIFQGLDLNRPCPSFLVSICFSWSDTREGFDYWQKVFINTYKS